MSTDRYTLKINRGVRGGAEVVRRYRLRPRSEVPFSNHTGKTDRYWIIIYDVVGANVDVPDHPVQTRSSIIMSGDQRVEMSSRGADGRRKRDARSTLERYDHYCSNNTTLFARLRAVTRVTTTSSCRQHTNWIFQFATAHAEDSDDRTYHVHVISLKHYVGPNLT